MFAGKGASLRRKARSRRCTRGVAPAAPTAPKASSVADSPRAARGARGGCRGSRRGPGRGRPRRAPPCTEASRSPPASRPVRPASRAPAARKGSRSPSDSRTAKRIATGATCRRRATNSSVCSEAWSSHWASSTTQISGRSTATRPSRVRTARPTRKRSGGLRPQPEGRAERVALGAGQLVHLLQVRPAELVQAGVGELDLGLDADGPADPAAGRAVEDVLQQRRLADPGLAAQNQRPGSGPLSRRRPARPTSRIRVVVTDQDRRTASPTLTDLTARTGYDWPLRRPLAATTYVRAHHRGDRCRRATLPPLAPVRRPK